jgi:predicted transcriptional regulator/DNA-binding XRE family transcriptional regulator
MTEPAAHPSRWGTKVRSLRRKEGLSQVQLAERLGISPSYLNLIENDRRPLTAPLLVKLAQVFKLDLATFAHGDEARTLSELMEVFGDPLFEAHGLTNTDVRELSSASPNMARAVLALYQAYQAQKETLAAQLEGAEGGPVDRSRLPSEEVSDLIQRHMNHFPALEEAAERLWRDAKLDADDLYRGLGWHLKRELGIEVKVISMRESRGAVRRYDPEKKELALAEILPPRSRNFEIAHQLCLLQHADILDGLTDDPLLTTEASRAVARVALANAFAGAVLMPYARFLAACRELRYDVELLGHRFRTSFEQVCHRMTTLRRPGAEGVPFHMIRIDVAGNISKRFSASGIRFARFSGACPRWNVFAALSTPGMIRVQLSKMPDGKAYFCIARTVGKDSGGYLAPHAVQSIGVGCPASYARELVYADGVDLENLDAAVPVGVTCRLCERMDCTQRAFPSLQHPLRVREGVRGVSFYAPVNEE